MLFFLFNELFLDVLINKSPQTPNPFQTNDMQNLIYLGIYDDYSGIKNSKYVNDDYVTYLTRYRASIAATTFYPTLKYWENAAAGCLTFMEITDKNDGKFTGFEDNKSAIFIDETNYKEKFQQFLNNPDDPKWKDIADAGRKFAMTELNNEKAVESIVRIIKNLI